MDELGQELDSVREALAMAREENQALLAREKDAAELRSLLEQKRGVSARLASGAEAARVRAERAESQAEKMVADGVSLRAQLKAARQQAETNGDRAKGLEENVSELRDEVRAMAAKLSDAEAAEAKATAGIDTATRRVSSLEEAMDAAEAERADVVRRLTQKDGDLVTLQSRLEETVSELEAVKLALVEGPSNSVGDGGGGGRGRIPGEAGVQATLREGVAGAHVVAAAAAAQTEANELKRQHAEAQEESRLARSELACVHLRTRMCGARVLSGVFHKWAARRAAGAFWRLRTTSTTGISSAFAGGVVSSCARCGAAGTGRHGSLDGNDRPTSAVLTIEAPTPSSQGGGGGGGGSGSGWTSPLSGYNQSGERGRERSRSAGSDKSCPEATAPAARQRQNRDRSGTGAADGFLRIRATANAPLTSPDEDSPGVFGFGGGHGGERGYQYRRRRSRARGGNANGRFSPPPPSPASSRARSMTSPPGGSFSIAWSNGGTDAVTPANSTPVDVAGGSGLIAPRVVGAGGGDTERSFFSTASSEPRYHCLRSGVSSPAWSNAGSWAGSADGVMPVDMSDASGEEEEEEEKEGAATAVPAPQPVSSDRGRGRSGGQGGSEDGGRGGGEVHGDGSEEEGFEFGLEVSVGGADSWWALSDEEVEV
ncbi:unnamed protein product [Ectocarpus sp. 12 AP-2014]